MTQNRLEIEILQDEFWWGGDIDDGVKMPFGMTAHTRDLINEGRGNQAVPLLISNKGRYIWSEKSIRFHFSGELLKVESENGDIVLSENNGNLRETFLAAANSHFPASGSVPDELFFTMPQYNLWIELQYEPTQEKTLAYAKNVLEQGMPPGVIMIDDNWMEDYGVWKFRKDRFPDPKGMTEELHALGFKVMLWTCPFISPDNAANFRYLEREGYLLKDEHGETAIRRWWNGYSAALDCTNPSAVEWYEGELHKLMDDYGIDGFKFDAGDPQFYRKSDQSVVQMHPNEHCEAWAKIGLNYSLNEYRSCWKSAGLPLVQRLGDKSHSWKEDGLASLIPNGLAQGLLGYAFTCPDMIGGGQIADIENNPTYKLDQELFVRYAQCSALFPMMQFSTAPWRVLDEEHLAYCVNAAKLHENFGPMIKDLAHDAAQTGEPIIRHMAYVFPEGGYEQIKDQFMLGNQILVAPVIVKGTRNRSIAFPKGRWQGDDGSIVQGPCSQTIEAPLSRLPWYRMI